MKIIHVVSMQMEKANLNLSNPNELDAMKLLQNAQNCYNTSKKKGCYPCYLSSIYNNCP